MRVAKTWGLLLFMLLGLPAFVAAQTATTGTMLGTVTDPQGAAVAGAAVELQNIARNQTFQQTTNAVGEYVFATVAPGVYKITATMKGFRTSTVPNFKVDVAKSYTVDFKLELGELAQTVQVEAQAKAELQTTDSTVGDVFSRSNLPRLASVTRSVVDILRIQPMSTIGGQNAPSVSGSRSDQNTFTLDGIDVTDNSIGTLTTYIPLPIDSVEEFRVGVANPNATFGRGAGGQVAVVSRGGTNAYHGLAYWYHQNDNLNANTWTLNRLPPPRNKKPELKDNRFGFNFGGPLPFLWSNKTFLFLNYEGRRFPRNTTFSRTVPTDTLKQGVLKFRDGAGNIVNYDLKTVALCSAAGNQACDPRGLGISPSVKAVWDLLPAGNDATIGDGLNTTGFTAAVRNPLTNDFYNIKLDHNVTTKWHADVSYRYFRQANSDAGQVSIVAGKEPLALRSFPLRDNFLSAGLRGQITSRLSGDFRFGWVRTRNRTVVLTPDQSAKQLNIPGTSATNAPPSGFIALDMGAASEPIDVGTQVARTQGNDNRIFQWNGDFTWVKGPHAFQFGTHVRYLPTKHLRNDKVLGSVGSLVAQVQSSSTTVIPSADRPPTCSTTITTNCIRSSDLATWNSVYASTLGIVDNVTILAVRDGQFNPLPFGSLLESDTKLWAPEFYLQDVWRIKPSLTLTLGLNYGWQTPPKERLNRQTIQIDGDTKQVISSDDFFAKRQQAALNGQIFNPNFAFMPVGSAGRDVFDIDWNAIGPRASAAWNPSFQGGFLGKLFGERKTVIRSGFAIIYDRQNTVQSVIIPALGIGFAQTLNFTAAACNITGSGGTACNPTSTNVAEKQFRVGVDGTLPVPQPPAQSVPVAPCWGICGGKLTLFPELLSFQVDPHIKVGRNYAVDLTWQRELPWSMLMEVGYAGRMARKIPQSMSLGNAPIMFVDPTSKQSFALAFDNVATALRGGVATNDPRWDPSAANTLAQAWFENLVGAGGTKALVTGNSTDFINGNVSTVFLQVDIKRILAGLQPFNNYISGLSFLRSSTGESNYHALFLTMHKRTSRGLQFDANYTFSRSLDQIGVVQNAAGFMPNSFNLNAEYGPSTFDFTHVFNARWLYELPFRSSRGALGRLIGGWYISGIFTAFSGAPLTVTEGNNVWGSGPDLFGLGFNSGAVPTVSIQTLYDNQPHFGVAGSSGIGTTGDPAKGGSGVNLFADPAAVFGNFRKVLLSQDGRSGRSRPVRGFPHWNLDASLGKKTNVTERLGISFSFDFFNIFNTAQFNDPSLSLLSPQSFGVVTSQFIPPERAATGAGSRWIQFGLRVEF